MSDNVTDPVALLYARHKKSVEDLEAIYRSLILRYRNGALRAQPGELLAALRLYENERKAVLAEMRGKPADEHLEEQLSELIAFNQATIHALKELS